MSLEIYVGPMFAGKTTKMIYMVLENQTEYFAKTKKKLL